ncbi:hypothetical protein [Aliikangiella sp. IMCC44359]|uniref:hypothetical protein n=1 Tax=Aliikangiella sp. IMCC44359 TaxID=3459125 RepID=UPI00403AD3DF
MNFNVQTKQVVFDNKLKKNEGLVLLRINSEVQNNILFLKNIETGQKFESAKLEGRYNYIFASLPAGVYKWSALKLNGSYFKNSSKVEGGDFEILAGKLNYPGDLDVVIWSRASGKESVIVRYVDRENTLPEYLFSLGFSEFHYSKLINE